MLVDFDETTDLDWFAVDSQGAVAHFATGGPGAVPAFWLQNRPLLREVRQVLLDNLPPIGEALINPTLDRFLSFPTQEARERYLRSFVEMASRGMFSFDYLHDHAPPTPYLLVARPEMPVLFETLPDPVKEKLRHLVLPGEWVIQGIVDIAAIG